jgi:hypothetical protein
MAYNETLLERNVMKKIMMNEETENGIISRVVLRSTDEGFQVDVFADGNQTGQEYTVQELRQIRELLIEIDLDAYIG